MYKRQPLDEGINVQERLKIRWRFKRHILPYAGWVIVSISACSNKRGPLLSLLVMHKNDRRESDDPAQHMHTQLMRTPGNRF